MSSGSTHWSTIRPAGRVRAGREPEEESEEDDADADRIAVLSGRARNWMVAASAVTVVSAVLTVVAN